LVVLALAALLVATLSGCTLLGGGGGCGAGATATTGTAGASGSAGASGTAGSCLRVLFVGNSYTSVNDLPGTVAKLVRSAGGSIEVSMIAPGGVFLSDHAADPAVATAIRGTAWTAVVFQEQSLAPASPDVLQGQSIPALLTLTSLARADGAQPWLLETWAHRDGWSARALDYASMQDAIDAGYEEMSARAGAPIIRAGEAWRRALAAAPGITLWQDDGSHPTQAGTYLAACAVYHALLGASPVGLSEHGGLSDDDATALQRAVAGQ
jgi:hypothetical protein